MSRAKQWNKSVPRVELDQRARDARLRLERIEFMARSGPYEALDDGAADKLLAERVEALTSTEHSKWISNQENAARRAGERGLAGKGVTLRTLSSRPLSLN